MSTFLPQEFIRTKRDGKNLPDRDIERFVAGITDGSVSEGQIAAFAMAVFFNGLEATEQAALTTAMTHSGDVLDWGSAALDGPVVDKHSTGGVGDKVSLVLAPIVAACGGYVPMISGRGLGHTGGTLDKLESIPGYDATPRLDLFARITREVGCSIIGQTGNLAPADRRFYAIRDVTATVESVPLITASILSKKLAAGLDGLVMDVKFGSGAFMDTADKARVLAENIVRVAGVAGLPVTALLTDMNQVLGKTAGNAVEIAECVAFLKGDAQEPRLKACTLELASQMLVLTGLADDAKSALGKATSALNSGRAADIFARMTVAQGGPSDFMENAERHLPAAPVVKSIHPEIEGSISAMDARAMGLAVVALGGGRTRADQEIDPAVGLTDIAGIGDSAGPEQPICLVHARDEQAADQAAAMVRAAIEISDQPVDAAGMVKEIITG
ncbi:MAG: thymidine phosphorylase [Sphingomonadales bacterium]